MSRSCPILDKVFPISTYPLVTRWQNVPQTLPVYCSVSCPNRARQDVKYPMRIPDHQHRLVQAHQDPKGDLELPQGSLCHNYNKFTLWKCKNKVKTPLWVSLGYLWVRAWALGKCYMKRLYKLKLSICMSIKWCKMQEGLPTILKTNPNPRRWAVSGFQMALSAPFLRLCLCVA